MARRRPSACATEPTESKIADALKEFSMTRIVTARRPATIAHADEVLALSERA